MKHQNKLTLSLLAAAIATVFNSFALESPEQNSKTSQNSNPLCTDLAKNADQATKEACLLERIEVKGRFLGFEVPEVVGRVFLSRDYIERAPKTSGDINELLTRLAGVQASDEVLDAGQMGEIRARELSISGGQPWQTGFFIDGINFNSRIDPGLSQNSDTRENDGVAQAFTVNSRLVEQVTVYDSNIPAEYGSFSGGVVDIKTRSPRNFDGSTFGFEYRTAADRLGDYHLIEENLDRRDDLTSKIPNYDIQDVGFYGVYKINNNHSLLLDASYTESRIDVLSLNQFVGTYRENLNVLLKYTATNLGVDRQDFILTYAPYQNDSIITHTLGSSQSIDQGGYAAQWQLEHDFAAVSWQSTFAYSTSDNSKQGAPHLKPWAQAKGRSWGELDPGNDVEFPSYLPISKEGNYGSLEKSQQDLSWRQKLLFDPLQWGSVHHQWQLGTDLEQQQLSRLRKQVHYSYGAAQIYSSNNAPLNCNGFYSDCLELALAMPLPELAASLGGKIDFSNPQHLAAYEANVVTTAQYFNFRQVYAPEDLQLEVKQAALFASDQIEWGKLQLNAGLRYNYDDFFKNHNLAPRLSAGYSLNQQGNQLLSLGLSRYYDANLMTYRLRELETPFYSEYRPLIQGVVQNWFSSSFDSDYRYRYTNLRTPFNDELSLSYKIATDQFGTYALKAVKRWKKDQLAGSGDPIKDNDGYLYREQDNSASGTYERLSLSWHHSIDIHSLWANFSWQDNWASTQSYDDQVDKTALDELVALAINGLDVQVITLASLNRQNLNFNRPIKFDVGMTSDWFDWFDSALTLSYVDGYTTIEQNSWTYRYQLNNQGCAGCELTYLTLPVYSQVEKRPRLLTDLSLRFKVMDAAAGRLLLTADFNNVMNQRTYLIGEGANGVERGRQVWLGLKYDFL